jgi:hypothetical protein
MNENGTISSKKNDKLVLGYGISPNSSHWHDLSNSYDWKKFKNLKGFEITPEDKKLGKCLKLVGENKWLEIPHGERIVGNVAWMRIQHGGQPHFNYTFNKDGTISPEEKADLVWGLADASETQTRGFRDVFANPTGWKKRRTEMYVPEKVCLRTNKF